MARRDDIVAYLADLLDPPGYEDYGPQGLQVEGCPTVDHVVTGVSVSVALVEAAARAGAQMILVHHGLFWHRQDPRLVGPMKRRIAPLVRSDISLAAYHLCLDAHAELGNNALAARRLELTAVQPWGMAGGKPIGVRGLWSPGLPVAEAMLRLEKLYGATPLTFRHGPDFVEHVGVISGGAQRELGAAIESGLDLFVTGEASEFVMHMAEEGKIHFAACGHYRTETLGIQAVGEHVAARFGVAHTFIDLPNPV